MPEILSGTQSGLTVSDIVLTICDEMGYHTSNNRVSNMIKRWINEVLREIQLADPNNSRTLVVDAEATLQADVSDYDVRDTTDNGGFGWTNCYKIKRLVIAEYSDYPLDMISIDQYRNQGWNPATVTGNLAHTVVILDPWRIRLIPTPTTAISLRGDYYQDIPSLTEGQLNWPKAWDQVIMEGVRYFAQRFRTPANVVLWQALYSRYQKLLEDMALTEVTLMPTEALMTRNIKRRRFLVDDPSQDIRSRY